MIHTHSERKSVYKNSKQRFFNFFSPFPCSRSIAINLSWFCEFNDRNFRSWSLRHANEIEIFLISSENSNLLLRSISREILLHFKFKASITKKDSHLMFNVNFFQFIKLCEVVYKYQHNWLRINI